MKNVKKDKAAIKELNSSSLKTRKKTANAIKVICFVLSMILVGVAAFYFAFIWDLQDYVFIDGTEKGTVIITEYIGSEAEVEVPNSLRGKKVIAIDNHAFSGKDITSVTIGKNVKLIGENAFFGCKNLQRVDLGKSVESIGTMAFGDCPLLAEFKFSPALKDVGYMLFRNNTKLTDFELNGNTNFKVENGVLYSGDMTVLYETLLSADLSSFKLPETVNELKPMAFYGQKELKSIELNSSIVSIPDGCFSMCTGLTELTIPEGVVTVGSLVLVGSSITTVKIGKSVKDIKDLAFEHNEVPVLDEDGKPVLDENGKKMTEPEHKIEIVTVKGSFAAKFAERKEIALKIVDKI